MAEKKCNFDREMAPPPPAAEFSRQMEPIWLFRRGRAAGRHCSSSHHRVRLPINTEVGPTNLHKLNFRLGQVLTG